MGHDFILRHATKTDGTTTRRYLTETSMIQLIIESGRNRKLRNAKLLSKYKPLHLRCNQEVDMYFDFKSQR